MNDTMYDLVRCSLYSGVYSPARTAGLSALLAALVVLLWIGGVRRLVSGSSDRLFTTLMWLLSVGAALPMLQHHVFGTRYPAARAALYYLPLFALVVVYALNTRVQRISNYQRRAFAAVLVLLICVGTVGWNWYCGYQHTPCNWTEDNHNVEVLETINQDRVSHSPRQPITLHSDRVFEPSLNFYRVTRGYEWLKRVFRPRKSSRTAAAPAVTGVGADYVYIYRRDITLLSVPYVVLASYDDIGTVVVRVEERNGH
jgi:hypothetical protein